ncbi:hypothetical protein [Actinomadura sp. WMMA1423]|uniref:hypothetical protein n=1 Tax=Actinomadura sp. WMMA1423 TaxID=2591108 RepID=UPI00143D1B6B|nr:hypothetical protein [Actinomadura sp. WMMA1423]
MSETSSVTPHTGFAVDSKGTAAPREGQDLRRGPRDGFAVDSRGQITDRPASGAR